ncbi:hypothetical protein BDV59DRAFT_174388 [Aspergillus ambiguus]|uniref:uncharacterized protein n=1 Tax=Aspergillus ambiguus TaxID=176160 RepID=UPI003CCCFD31
MLPRTIYLVLTRPATSQRAHFAIFVPSATNPQRGSLINVVGAPMMGFMHEFQRGYDLGTIDTPHETYAIGQVDPAYIVDWPDGLHATHSTPQGDIEVAASQIPAPGISENFMAPVNETTNRRCQEWTLEYVRHLVAKGYIGNEAIQIVQSKRDPPDFGIGLRPVGVNLRQ